ncbi:ankyrin [Thermothelomyces heterothallicus CBS 203.75]
MLVRAGADVGALNSTGWTPLHLAARTGSADTVRYLASLSASAAAAAAAGPNGWTPLHWAADGGHVEAALELLRAGARLGIKDRNGRTPEDLARLKGFREMEQLFMEHGFQNLRF